MKNVPRYTSYPTAPHFHAGIDEAVFSEWLAQISRDLSLYLHIPYCDRLCWFCGCHTKIINHYSPVSRYLDLLFKEIDKVSGLVSLGETPKVTHLHFGGGSPTMLGPQDFSDLVALLRTRFDFSSQAQIDIEIDPRTCDRARIEAYAASGVTRASLGLQDFNPDVQKAINRPQPFSLVKRVVDDLRQAGINALNADLIYGLPLQTLEGITISIEKTLALAPNRIALFGYAHVPWMKKHQNLIDTETLPGPAMRLEMFEHATKLFEQAGYVAIGIDHFARADDPLAIAYRGKTLGRNFQGYTTDLAENLLGIGLSSISSLAQGYAQNTLDFVDYAKRVEAGNLPVIKGIALRDQDRVRRDIIMSLMSQLHVEIDPDLYVDELRALGPYIDEGMVQREGGQITILPHARSQVRLIASVFDEWLENKPGRYSQAI